MKKSLFQSKVFISRYGMNLVLVLLAVGVASIILNSCSAHCSIIKGPAMFSFFRGVSHGIISPLTALGQYIWPQVSVFETRNIGHGYGLGFVLGCMIVGFPIINGCIGSIHKIRL